jgi:serine/threonine protein kinase
LLLAHPGGDYLKICDFGLSRRIDTDKMLPLDFGMPEFVAPEVVNREGVGFGQDMWSIGIITYILLGGSSPFRGAHDRETLTKIRDGKWSFYGSVWEHITEEGRDFITKLLVYSQYDRMDIKTALKHPWFDILYRSSHDEYQISTDKLRSYHELMRDWYNNASCRLWYRRRPLLSAFDHPSKMVYPPGWRYTPENSPPPTPAHHEEREKRGKWEDYVARDRPDFDIASIKSESQ